MAALTTPVCDFGAVAPDFSLPATDGKIYSLSDIRGPNGTLIMFICNHCPFVKAVIDRIVADAKILQAAGIGIAAINANDPDNYPDDAPDKMPAFAQQYNLPFPYLFDETQEVAQAYGAVCTPDFFGYNANGELQYRGRLDESRMQPVPNARRELLEAMQQIAKTGQGPTEQQPSMGCNIKWREGMAA
ncbi:MAG TPA: thioredoxin family protein [Alphaproteobacteria bacterium]|nr:thioredoxin family protein [Rhodospirillaceae bacterium]HRJ12859.1 thioredoxin family protein [Alphaproteobacteria bacterium]